MTFFRSKLHWFLLIGVLTIGLVWAAVEARAVFASDGENKDISEMNTEEVLTYAKGPGINSLAGIGWYIFAGLLPGFGRLNSKIKRLSMLLFCLAIPVGATIALWQINGSPDRTGAILSELWKSTQAGFTAFSTSQIAHTRDL